MRRTAAILALVTVVSMFGASDVRGSGAGAPLVGTPTGPNMTATIVMDLTGVGSVPVPPGKGQTSIRVQRSDESAAAFFISGVIFGPECNSILGEVDSRFFGKLNGWVPGSVLESLFGTLGNQAAIVDTDYATCTDVNGRHILSFTALIKFDDKQ
jgi:hypothetical protein